MSRPGPKSPRAEVGVQEASQSLERATVLHESGAASAKTWMTPEQLQLAQNKLREAQSALEQASGRPLESPGGPVPVRGGPGPERAAGGAVEEARAYLENTLLQAPMSGYITQKYLEEGELVNAGTPVLEITDIEHTYVKVFISETKIGRVHLDQEAEITVASFPDRVFPGRVVWINDAGDFAVRKAVNEQDEHDLRSFEVKIDLPNPDLVLKTGMTARVKLLEEVN